MNSKEYARYENQNEHGIKKTGNLEQETLVSSKNLCKKDLIKQHVCLHNLGEIKRFHTLKITRTYVPRLNLLRRLHEESGWEEAAEN